MPLKKSIKCSICEETIRGTKDVEFKERMAKVRRHRKRSHPKAHKESIERALKTKREKGIINKKGGKMGKKKKWGRIGPPKSAKRKRWLAKIRKKRR